jgi:hypothetical protein
VIKVANNECFFNFVCKICKNKYDTKEQAIKCAASHINLYVDIKRLNLIEEVKSEKYKEFERNIAAYIKSHIKGVTGLIIYPYSNYVDIKIFFENEKQVCEVILNDILEDIFFKNNIKEKEIYCFMNDDYGIDFKLLTNKQLITKIINYK